MVKFVSVGKVPTQKVYSKSYMQFKGVDFASAQTKVADDRSPDCLNMLAREGGIVKRRGWEILADGLGGRMNGIYKFSAGNFLLHCGTKLYRWDGETATDLDFAVNDARSSGFNYEEKLYILTGTQYLVYDGEAVSLVSEAAFIPYTSIAGKDIATENPAENIPAYAGESFQPVNLLSAKRKNTFITRVWEIRAEGEETATKYGINELYLDSVASSVEEVLVRGLTVDAASYSLVHYMIDNNGEIKPAESIDTALFSAVKLNEGNFPSTNGAPDCEVTFTALNGTEKAADINNCSIASIYSNRVFFAGNPDKPNIDWACELNDPSYVPDNSYTMIGTDNGAIMGYLRMGDNQAIVKAENTQDATIFLRSADLTDVDMIFPVKQGVAGNGAISKYCFAHLIDDPLFLTRNGVYALATVNVTAEKTMQMRSWRVNPKLTEEPDLEEAVAVEWNGYYLLCVNGHVYLADSRQRSYTNNTTGTFEYEWFFWNNVPARVLFEDEGLLYFGTNDGELCKFKTDAALMSTYSDGYLVGAAKKEPCAINAYWATGKSDDNSFMTLKTMPKRGCGIYLKTYNSSSVDVFVLTDRDLRPRSIVSQNAGIFDFSDLDFENFTFNTLPQAVVPFNTKVKKYKTIQVIVRNDKLNQGFGVYGIERKFVYGNYVK